ncbi:MAG: phospholipase D-like domain-containing protein [Woeseia sp.]
MQQRPNKKSHPRFQPILAAVLAIVVASGCQNLTPLPDGTSLHGQAHPSAEVAFIADASWVDDNGQRHVEQALFDDLFRIIDEAREIIVLDMFLYNDFQGPVPETTRQLAGELTDALVEKKNNHPDMLIVVITDPVNELYGGLQSPYFEQLEQAGIRLAVTNLRELHDSNAFYSFFWRLLFKPFGNSSANTLPNPIGPGRVSIRSYLELINFKANHRKVLIADNGPTYVGFVSSANPHDGSSAHRNAAIRFTGGAVADLLQSENAVLKLSGHAPIELEIPRERAAAATTVQVVTEGKIEDAVLAEINRAKPGDQLDLMMFYLSDREVIAALKLAHERGANLRLLLDPNKDAFGREKNGIPNRPVAHELNRAGIPVRWCSSKGEQCHSKMLLLQDHLGGSVIVTGSANFTRRNLDNFNLETDVVVRGSGTESVFADAHEYFENSWNNTDGRIYSLPYVHYEDTSFWRRRLYRFMEWSGISTF